MGGVCTHACKIGWFLLSYEWEWAVFTLILVKLSGFYPYMDEWVVLMLMLVELGGLYPYMDERVVLMLLLVELGGLYPYMDGSWQCLCSC